MKTMMILVTGLIGICGCESRESSFKMREGVHRELAANAGKAERERFLRADLAMAERRVAACRIAVFDSANARQLALAEDDLREARRQQHKIEDALAALD